MVTAVMTTHEAEVVKNTFVDKNPIFGDSDEEQEDDAETGLFRTQTGPARVQGLNKKAVSKKQSWQQGERLAVLKEELSDDSDPGGAVTPAQPPPRRPAPTTTHHPSSASERTRTATTRANSAVARTDTAASTSSARSAAIAMAGDFDRGTGRSNMMDAAGRANMERTMTNMSNVMNRNDAVHTGSLNGKEPPASESTDNNSHRGLTTAVSVPGYTQTGEERFYNFRREHAGLGSERGRGADPDDAVVGGKDVMPKKTFDDRDLASLPQVETQQQQTRKRNKSNQRGEEEEWRTGNRVVTLGGDMLLRTRSEEAEEGEDGYKLRSKVSFTGANAELTKVSEGEEDDESPAKAGGLQRTGGSALARTSGSVAAVDPKAKQGILRVETELSEQAYPYAALSPTVTRLAENATDWNRHKYGQGNAVRKASAGAAAPPAGPPAGVSVLGELFPASGSAKKGPSDFNPMARSPGQAAPPAAMPSGAFGAQMGYSPPFAYGNTHLSAGLGQFSSPQISPNMQPIYMAPPGPILIPGITPTSGGGMFPQYAAPMPLGQPPQGHHHMAPVAYTYLAPNGELVFPGQQPAMRATAPPAAGRGSGGRSSGPTFDTAHPQAWAGGEPASSSTQPPAADGGEFGQRRSHRRGSLHAQMCEDMEENERRRLNGEPPVAAAPPPAAAAGWWQQPEGQGGAEPGGAAGGKRKRGSKRGNNGGGNSKGTHDGGAAGTDGGRHHGSGHHAQQQQQQQHAHHSGHHESQQHARQHQQDPHHQHAQQQSGASHPHQTAQGAQGSQQSAGGRKAKPKNYRDHHVVPAFEDSIRGTYVPGNARWHDEAKDFGRYMDGEPQKRFCKDRTYHELLSTVTEADVRCSGRHRYCVRFQENADPEKHPVDYGMSPADGFGFVFSDKLPCPKNIQRIQSIFLSKKGIVSIRRRTEVTRCKDFSIRPFESGDYIYMEIDLMTKTCAFWIEGKDSCGRTNGPPKHHRFNYGGCFPVTKNGAGLEKGFMTTVLKNQGVAVELVRYELFH